MHITYLHIYNYVRHKKYIKGHSVNFIIDKYYYIQPEESNVLTKMPNLHIHYQFLDFDLSYSSNIIFIIIFFFSMKNFSTRWS